MPGSTWISHFSAPRSASPGGGHCEQVSGQTPPAVVGRGAHALVPRDRDRPGQLAAQDDPQVGDELVVREGSEERGDTSAGEVGPGPCQGRCEDQVTRRRSARRYRRSGARRPRSPPASPPPSSAGGSCTRPGRADARGRCVIDSTSSDSTSTPCAAHTDRSGSSGNPIGDVLGLRELLGEGSHPSRSVVPRGRVGHQQEVAPVVAGVLGGRDDEVVDVVSDLGAAESQHGEVGLPAPRKPHRERIGRRPGVARLLGAPPLRRDLAYGPASL